MCVISQNLVRLDQLWYMYTTLFYVTQSRPSPQDKYFSKNSITVVI